MTTNERLIKYIIKRNKTEPLDDIFYDLKTVLSVSMSTVKSWYYEARPMPENLLELMELKLAVKL